MATCSSAGKQYLINYNPCSEIKFVHYITESFQDKVKKQESVITSQQVQIQNTEEMLRLNAVRNNLLLTLEKTV